MGTLSDGSMPKGAKGILAYSLQDWKDRCEFTVDLEETKPITHVQIRFTPKQHYLIGYYGISNRLSFQDAAIALMGREGFFDRDVDYEGTIITRVKPSKKDIIDLHQQQGKLF